MTASLPSWLLVHESFELEPIPGAAAPAKVVQDGRAWAAKMLPLATGRATGLTTAVANLAADETPGLLRYRPIEASKQGVCLVREWAHGFPLLTVLRKRRSIEVTDVLLLVAGIPALIDSVVAAPWMLPRKLLGKVFVVFPAEVTADQLAVLPGKLVGTWGPFDWKLDGLSVAEVLSDNSESAGQMTMVASRAPSAVPDKPVTRLAALLYELLGGNPEYIRQRHCPPLASLPERANRTLRDALMGGYSGTCEELWKVFLAALKSDGIDVRVKVAPPPRAAPPKPAPPKAAPIELKMPPRRTLLSAAATPPPPPPPPPAAVPVPARAPAPAPAPAREKERTDLPPTLGTMARFMPSAGAPITLVARRQFRIGRSLEEADFVARHWPDTPENRRLTERIGRVHVVVTITAKGLVLFDGSGGNPSVNGSYFDGNDLSPDEPTELDRRAVVHLGSRFALEVIPLNHRLPVGAESRFHAAPNVRQPSAVLFMPIDNGTPVHESLWLLSTIGFSLDPVGRPVWNLDPVGASPAAFLYRDGGFWLLNISLPADALVIEGKALAAGTCKALVHKQRMHIGRCVYQIEIA